MIVVAFAHLFVTLGLFVWQAPRAEWGLPEPAAAKVAMTILCFPIILLGRLDELLPQHFRVPEFFYPVTWCVASALWGLAVAAIVNLCQAHREHRTPNHLTGRWS